MKLKFKVTKLEDVPEQFRTLYEQGSDGNFYLAVDGAADKTKLDEFRTNNVDLLKKLEAFKDVDPAKVTALLENERKIAEKKLIDAGDIDGLVNQRVANMKSEYDGQVKKLTDHLQANTAHLERLLIDNEVRTIASKVGVAHTAVEDVLLRAKSTFTIKDGKPVAVDTNGQVIYGKNGSDPLAINDWVSGLKEQAPHLFMTSSGSGATRQGPGAGGEKLTATQKISAGLAGGSSILS